ncbi:M48 family metallopeptidase [Jiulongibacter sediminis]|uniref:Peptidase M48 domain-containing protein n=1 Tax=Jiulongibacter sediminis TaxID=1605367 RepID=A0A0N8H9V1_9BACT|nr:M48 family metallopeptidase [Jiulongibacter sediminis]KPM48396.1 hypothetical protein AFM12_07080 [Jiulongibacter sediminis]TBX24936.1 hypothetical protein TK44_07085 [Jiulongibacter sediminis]
MEIEISESFRKNVVLSAVAVTLFILFFNALVILGFGFAAFSLIIAVAIVSVSASILGIILALGFVFCGFLIVAFLLKFLFASKDKQESDLRLEIDRSQAPGLFELIDELVDQIGTEPPRKVYISTHVNAMVFYESRFWSLFFPSRKSLEIGMGLICSTTSTELKAVLAHEFGHFAQKSMILGTYVSSLNAIIYNQLYHNDSYNELADTIGGIHFILNIFVSISRVIVRSIQKVMIKAYEILNIRYLALSRDMEFNADEVAVHLTGKQPLIRCLSRLSFADSTLDEVFSYYESRGERLKFPENLYPHFERALNFLSAKHQLQLKNGLPLIGEVDRERYGKSKLNFEDQWASHPALSERLKRIERLEVTETEEGGVLSTTLFLNIENLQKKLTREVFKGFENKENETLSTEEFEQDYALFYEERNYSKVFNNYYSDKTPVFRIQEEEQNCTLGITELFSEKAVSRLYEDLFLNGDLQMLQNISENVIKVKFFEYNHQRYSTAEVNALIRQLEEEQHRLSEQIKEHDEQIASCLVIRSKEAGLFDEFKSKAEAMNRYYDSFDDVQRFLDDCFERTAFFAQNTEFVYISKYINYWKEIENELKQKIEELLKDRTYQKVLGEELTRKFSQFVDSHYAYFDGETTYFEPEIEHLFQVLNHFPGAFEATFLETKKDLLKFIETLLEETSVA